MADQTPDRSADLPNGVMFNAYPDSIGTRLSDTVAMLQRPEFDGVFSLFYVLPTFFHSDLDRGFSVIDYDRNEEFVSPEDVAALADLGIGLKFDLVLNHLSVNSPQFKDLLARGDASPFKDFFIDWNAFWAGKGRMSAGGYIIPDPPHLTKLFMRKPGLPILMVRFPDGSDRPYWNTFYQEVSYPGLDAGDLDSVDGLTPDQAADVVGMVNAALRVGVPVADLDFGPAAPFKDAVIDAVEAKRTYLGQMDMNAKADIVWDFYDETLGKLAAFGAKLIRLDAFAYLHKEPGETNFFNKPGTWEYLARIRALADKHGLTLLPEIHSEYHTGLHAEVAAEGYRVYDFFLPGLMIDALDRGTTRHLRRWIAEIQNTGLRTVNMLGCHDGIPVLDLKGDDAAGTALIDRDSIDATVDRILERGGRVKNLFGPDGKRIAYYQVNAAFYSALGEDDRKLRLARAIQMFMPGIPQVWYLDLFAGANDYAAADRGGTGGHKEINRTTLSAEDVDRGLARTVVRDQLDIMRLRNQADAFNGDLTVPESADHELTMRWTHGDSVAELTADLKTLRFTIRCVDAGGHVHTLSYA
jgi:sucrose phosphorylase